MTQYDQPFYVGINNPRFKGVSSDGYLPALEPPVEQPPQPSSRIIGVSSYDLKWREREIKRLENKLEKLDSWVASALHIIETKKIPVTVVKLSQADLEKQEARQWDKINQLELKVSSILKEKKERTDRAKRKPNKYIIK